MEETFQIRNQSGGWRARKAWNPEVEATQVKELFSWIPFAALEQIAEIGAEQGQRGLTLKNNYLGTNAVYVGFSPETAAAKQIAPGAELRPITPTGGLSLGNASQDLFLSAYALENLRMDHLYMALSEARRIVRPDGYAALLAWSPGETLLEKGMDWYCRKWRGENPLRLDHYLSPEDWDVVKEASQSSKGRRVQMMLLRRRLDI